MCANTNNLYNREVECLSDNLEALVIITLTPFHAEVNSISQRFQNSNSNILAPSRLSGNILFTKYNQ